MKCPALAGAAPLFFSERALKKLRERKTKPMSYNWVRALPARRLSCACDHHHQGMLHQHAAGSLS